MRRLLPFVFVALEITCRVRCCSRRGLIFSWLPAAVLPRLPRFLPRQQRSRRQSAAVDHAKTENLTFELWGLNKSPKFVFEKSKPLDYLDAVSTAMTPCY